MQALLDAARAKRAALFAAKASKCAPVDNGEGSAKASKCAPVDNGEDSKQTSDCAPVGDVAVSLPTGPTDATNIGTKRKSDILEDRIQEVFYPNTDGPRGNQATTYSYLAAAYSSALWLLLCSYHVAIRAMKKTAKPLDATARKFVMVGCVLRLVKKKVQGIYDLATSVSKPRLLCLVWGYDTTTIWHRTTQHPSRKLQKFIADGKDMDSEQRKAAGVPVADGKMTHSINRARTVYQHSLVQTGQLHCNDLNVHETFFIPPRRQATTSAMHTGAGVLGAIIEFVCLGRSLITWLVSAPFQLILLIIHSDQASGNLLFHKFLRAVQWLLAPLIKFLLHCEPCHAHIAVRVLVGFLDRFGCQEHGEPRKLFL